jgi:hypothetical protein
MKIKSKYSLSFQELLDLEEILILSLYPTGILAKESNIIKNIKIDTRTDRSIILGKKAKSILKEVKKQVYKNKKFNDFCFLERIYRLCSIF